MARAVTSAIDQSTSPSRNRKRHRTQKKPDDAKLHMTDRWVESVSVEKGREEYSDLHVIGLRLRVSRLRKVWSVIWRRDGKLTRENLGEYPEVALKQARDAADEILRARTAQDAAVAMTESKAALAEAARPKASVRDLCKGYVASLKAAEKSSWSKVASALTTGKNCFVSFVEEHHGAAFPAEDVTPKIVTDWLRETFTRVPNQMNHCRGYVHSAYNWALRADYDAKRPKGAPKFGLSANPAAPTAPGPKPQPRNRKLSEAEILVLWRMLPEVASPLTTLAIRLMITMGGKRISEISRSEKAWYRAGWLHLPTTKNEREDFVPLSEHAKRQLSIIMALTKPRSPFLFPNERDKEQCATLECYGKATRKAINEFSLVPFQLRDLRRTFKSHLLDLELVEERDIDIWHDHGRQNDIARKHYDWAELKAPKLRVAAAIDTFLDNVLQIGNEAHDGRASPTLRAPGPIMMSNLATPDTHCLQVLKDVSTIGYAQPRSAADANGLHVAPS